MTNDNTLLELAERCERAPGPSRELDCAILAAIDWREPDWEEGERTVREMVARRGLSAFAKSADEGMSIWRHLPRLTASLDAAMSLVDDELVTLVMREALDRLDECFNPLDNYLVKLRLFVCAAALRARANQEPNNG